MSASRKSNTLLLALQKDFLVEFQKPNNLTHSLKFTRACARTHTHTHTHTHNHYAV